jgi:hypothetical protein
MAVAVLLLVVPPAQGATEVDLDRDHGVRFVVDGPVLTVRLEPQTGQRPPDIRMDVWGRAVRVACSPLFTADDRRLLRAVVTSELFWPNGQLELSFTFDRDISERVKWCLLESAGGEDVAGAMFEPFIRVLADPLRERRMGWALRRYIRSREDAEAWLPRAFAIVVLRGGRTAISTELARNARGRSVAARLCGLVHDSPVPLGPTAVFGRGDALLRSCSGRRIDVAQGVRPPEP